MYFEAYRKSAIERLLENRAFVFTWRAGVLVGAYAWLHAYHGVPSPMQILNALKPDVRITFSQAVHQKAQNAPTAEEGFCASLRTLENGLNRYLRRGADGRYVACRRLTAAQ